MSKEVIKNNSDVAGHRDRLREKFRKSRLEGFHDYEIVELLLTFGTPQKDTRQPARDAIKKFKNLRGVLEASIEELQEIRGVGPINAVAIKFIQEVARAYLQDKITEPQGVKSSQEVFQYLYHSLRDRKKELFKVLYLNSQNHILAAEDLFKGTVNSSAVSPREVVESALKHNAVSLIFVHNHPSGNPEPSQSDKDLTRDLIFAAGTINLKVLDHVIIGNDKYYSFAGTGLIDQYQAEFEVLKRKGVSGVKPDRPSAKLASDGLPWKK